MREQKTIEQLRYASELQNKMAFKYTQNKVMALTGKILEHTCIRKQILSQCFIHICPMRQVFPETEFPIHTKSYITL